MILVVFRDLLIVGGLLLLLVLRKHWEVRPVLVSKVNTGLQIFLAGAVLAQSGLSIAIAEIVDVAAYCGRADDRRFRRLVPRGMGPPYGKQRRPAMTTQRQTL